MNAIVLAAGMSLRMGEKNKLLMSYGDSTILETTIQNIKSSDIKNITVVVGHDEDEITERLTRFNDIQIVNNPDYQTGQVSSLKAGLNSQKNDEPFMVALSDMPLIKRHHYNNLIETFLKCNSLRPLILRPISKSNMVGNPVLFDPSFKTALLNNKDLESSRKVIISHKDSVILWKSENSCYFTDIDTPDAYEKLISSGS